jgi:cation transport ATPase
MERVMLNKIKNRIEKSTLVRPDGYEPAGGGTSRSSPESQESRLNRPNDSDSEVESRFFVQGMACPACARLIERSLKEIPEIKRVEVDFASKLAVITFGSAHIGLEEANNALEGTGYSLQAQPMSPARSENAISRIFVQKYIPILIGIGAVAGVILFYLVLNTIISDWYNARLQFDIYRWWILVLAAGLGIQAALFSSFRFRMGRAGKRERYSLAASGGMSGTAMAACCAHYLVPILPLIGLPFLSAAAAGLAQYQTYFFLAGVLSNLLGIGFMLRVMHISGMMRFGTRFGRLKLSKG